MYTPNVNARQLLTKADSRADGSTLNRPFLIGNLKLYFFLDLGFLVTHDGNGGWQILAKIPILSGLYKVEIASYKHVLYMFLVPFDSKNTSRNFSEASETWKLIFSSQKLAKWRVFRGYRIFYWFQGFQSNLKVLREMHQKMPRVASDCFKNSPTVFLEARR